jgi:carbamoyltransferase
MEKSSKHCIGLSQGFHDAGVAVIDWLGNIVFAGHSERYSRVKNDKDLNPEILNDAAQYCDGPVEYHYYERKWLTDLRRLAVGQSLSGSYLLPKKRKSWNHHLSHAAAAFQTSPFDSAAVVVVDAIGELDTITIWKASYDTEGKAQYKKVWSRWYPNSVGLFYSAMTRRIGLKPMEDEYILMGLSAYGDSNKYHNQMVDEFLKPGVGSFKKNLHKGCDRWEPDASDKDIAAATQSVTEMVLFDIHNQAKFLTGEVNVCLGGGVALNCLFNGKLGQVWKNVWVCPNPGDCGSALGAAALGYGGKLNWKDAFLGYDIQMPLPINEIIHQLLTTQIVGVANGRAEWGPRSLGNRSLLADPIPRNMKDRVNKIKGRQEYRPFAPAILSEHANDYFKLNEGFDYSYMQFAVPATKAQMFPSVCHVDGTARVQVVKPGNSNLRKILEAWYAKTGCPILLNTSLNIKGEPIVNDYHDARKWQVKYGVKVF